MLCARILVLVHVFCGPGCKLIFCKARRYHGAVHSVCGSGRQHSSILCTVGLLVPVDLYALVLVQVCSVVVSCLYVYLYCSTRFAVTCLFR